MKIEEFTLERIQSLFENTVEFNLSDSGVHPLAPAEILTAEERERIMGVELGYGWTNGSPGLRRTVARLYAGRDEDNVIITNGGAEANMLVGMTLVEPGDEIIVVVPNYLQLWGWAKALGATVREIRLREELDWAPDLDDLARAATPRTRLVSLCTPNNPTGSLLSRDAMQRLVEFCRERDLYLHADEIYQGAELAGDERPSFADLYDKAIVTNGLSKAMALPGLRIGWLIGPRAEVYGAWQRKDYTSITTGALSEAIADIVLQPDRRRAILQHSRTVLARNLAILDDWVAGHQGRFSFVRPRAGGMAFLKYHFPMNSTQFAHLLRQDYGVLVLPGDVYGMDGYVRVGIGAREDVLRGGLDRVSAALARMPGSGF